MKVINVIDVAMDIMVTRTAGDAAVIQQALLKKLVILSVFVGVIQMVSVLAKEMY